MPYNFDLAVSARISPAVAEEMIRRVVEEQTGRTVDTIEVKLRDAGTKPGDAVTLFDGFLVTFKTEQPVRKPKVHQGFVPTTYS